MGGGLHLDELGPVDAVRFAGEFATQLVVERIISQLVDVERVVAAVSMAAEQDEYVRQVARWVADRAE